MTLRIVVTARHLPDDASSDSPLSELDEYAVEQALRTTVAHERVSVRRSGAGAAEVTVVTVGPRVAPGTLRKVLSLGADRVVHVMDDDPCGTDAPGTSLMLTRAVRKAGYDLVVAGMARADGTLGVVSVLLSEHLGVPSSPGRPRRGARTSVRDRRDGADASVRPRAPGHSE